MSTVKDSDSSRPAVCWTTVILLVGLHCSEGSAAVGRIAGDFAVSSIGAATYSIPIGVADSANSMQPDIALAYSSHAPDGLAGVGWNLSGFSTIARCGLTRATNSKRKGVTYTSGSVLPGRPAIDLNQRRVWRGEYRVPHRDS
jgi:hypothetical protein